MYLLKTIRKLTPAVMIYKDTFPVEEEECFFELGSNFRIQYHWNEKNVMATVVDEGMSRHLIHREDSAYIINSSGETLKVINKA